MEISIKYQLLTSLFSIIIGMYICSIYDCFKIIRNFINGEISHKLKNNVLKLKLPLINLKFKEKSLNRFQKAIYIVFDLLFFICITPIMLIFVHDFSNGIVRWYIIIGATFGFVLHYFTISRFIVVIYECIAIFIKILISYLFFFIKLPISKLIIISKNKIIAYKMKKKAKVKGIKEKKQVDNNQVSKVILLCLGKNNHRL
ncbi:MAG: spore cortex biosynthesis protein YabQ [Clostridia bacterium]|nr:spore cortex biosynthesis protein YabQ [Clostridia bacterium]